MESIPCFVLGIHPADSHGMEYSCTGREVADDLLKIADDYVKSKGRMVGMRLNIFCLIMSLICMLLMPLRSRKIFRWS